MKRFFCRICQKVKRVQSIPRLITNETAENPYERVGECNHHSMGRLRIVSTRVRPSKPIKQPIIQSNKSRKRA